VSAKRKIENAQDQWFDPFSKRLR